MKDTRMIRVVQGVKDLLNKLGRTGERIIVEKEKILRIIPYRSDKIYLDRLVITDDKVTGQFLITSQACDGHEIGGQPVFRGIDIAEMAAQVLGVWAAQFSELKDKSAFFSEVDLEVSAKFIRASIPGEVLIVEITKLKLPKKEEERLTEEEAGEKRKNPKFVTSGRPDRPIRRVMGKDILVKVKGQKDKSTAVRWISLKTLEPQSLAE